MSTEKIDNQVKLGVTKEIELPKLDLKKFVGQKTQVMDVTEHKGEYGYYVKIATPVLETIGEGDKAINLQATRIFGLQENSEGVIGWGVDTKLGVFLKSMGVAHYNDLKGKDVVVQLRVDKNGSEFLTIA